MVFRRYGQAMKVSCACIWGICAVVLVSSVQEVYADTGRPHIVLVMADDHGYGDCGYTGHPFVKTPHLDAMAQDSVVFDRFYASSPVCSPTRAAFLTGRHAFRVNVPNHGHYLRPQEVTLAEVLREDGYITGHFGKWHIGSVQPDSPTTPGGQGFDEWLSGLNFFDRDPYLSHNGKYLQAKGQGTVIATDATIDFLTEHHAGDRPMLAVTWFPAPHGPFGEVPDDIEGAATLYDDQDTQKAGYFREITLLDQQVGRLRSALRDLGIAEDTILLYCSDNGGLEAKSSGGREKKGSIYDGGLRVPALLEWPSTLAPRKVAVPVNSCDVFPTVLAMAGIEYQSPHPLDGIDISQILAGRQDSRPAMGFWHGFQGGEATWSDRIIKSLLAAEQAGEPTPHPRRLLKNVEQYPDFTDAELRGHAAWLDWPWKYHRIENAGRVVDELYDLSVDPGESKNLSAQHEARADAMRTALEAWQNSVLESWQGGDY